MAARLQKLALLSLAAASLSWASIAFAGGRAGWRFAYPWEAYIWAEQTLWALSFDSWRVEAVAGIEYGGDSGLTPYSAVYVVSGGFWLGLQTGKGLGAFRFALIGGVEW